MAASIRWDCIYFNAWWKWCICGWDPLINAVVSVVDYLNGLLLCLFIVWCTQKREKSITIAVTRVVVDPWKECTSQNRWSSLSLSSRFVAVVTRFGIRHTLWRLWCDEMIAYWSSWWFSDKPCQHGSKVWYWIWFMHMIKDFVSIASHVDVIVMLLR